MTTDKMTVEAQGRELKIDRVFDASPELMFQMWTSCEHLKHWWGPREWPMEECSLDFRVGGAWHFCLRGPNQGDESWGKAVYREIEKPTKIVYQDNFSDEDGNINEEMPGMLITIEFHEYEGKTRVVSTTLFDTPETRRKIVEMGAVAGMSSSMDRLDEYLEKMPHEKTADLVLTHIFDAQIENVWRVWTVGKLVKQWWGPDGFTCILADMDVREGGKSHVGMRASEQFGGKDYYNIFEYTHIEPLELIQYISDFADKDGNVITPVAAGLPAETPMHKKQQIAFKDLGDGKTQVTVKEFGWPAEGVMIKRSRLGLEQSIANIEKILSGQAK